MALSASSSLRGAAPPRAGMRRGLMGSAPALRFDRARRVKAAAAGSGAYDTPNAALVKAIDAADFDSVVGSGYTLVDCFTDWCGPCKLVAPFWADLAAESAGAPLQFRKFDCQSDPKRSSALAIKALPSFVAFKDGVEVGRIVGSNKDAMRQFVEEHKKASLAAFGAEGAAAVPETAAASVAA